MNWVKILEAVGIGSALFIAITLIIGFFGKSFFQHLIDRLIEVKKAELQKELETHKQKLSSESEINRLEISKNIEEYRSQLESIRNEIQIKTSQLHTERLQIIKELYSMLVLFENRVSMLVISGSGKEDNDVKEVNRLYYDIKTKFWTNRIFFNEHTSELLEKLIGKLQSALFKYRRIIDDSMTRDEAMGKSFSEFERKRGDYYSKKIDSNWERASEIVENEVPSVLKVLENDFRQLIGVS